MPIDFRILPARGLVYVRYEGILSVPETVQGFGAYMQHPDMRPGQKQLIDISRVTGWDKDFAGLLQLQATKADAFIGVGHEVLFVYFAPTEQTRLMGRTILRSWEEVPGVIPLVQETEADALHVLGQPERTIDALLQNA